MLDIYSISEQENKFVKDASSEFGEYFFHAKETTEFTQNFIESGTLKPNAWVFFNMFTQVQKNLVLALLSTVRLHSTQAEMDLRQVLESIVLSAYAIENPNEDDFIIRKDDNSFDMKKQKDKNNKIRDWFKKDYREYSDKIKNYKDMINEINGHSSLVIAQKNFRLEENEAKFFLFDVAIKKHVLLDLWKISNISLGSLDIIYNINIKHSLFAVVKDFEIKMKNFFDTNVILRNNLEKHFK